MTDFIKIIHGDRSEQRCVDDNPIRIVVPKGSVVMRVPRASETEEEFEIVLEQKVK